MPTQSTKLMNSSSDTLMVKSDYVFNFFTDLRKLKIIDDWKFAKNYINPTFKIYDSGFMVYENFYIKYEVEIQKLFNEEIYFCIESLERQTSVYFQLIKLSKSAILKIFEINIYGRKRNIYRTDLKVLDNYKLFTFVFVKNSKSLTLNIGNRYDKKNTLFTFPNLNYMKFYFSTQKESVIKNIYISDTTNNNNQK
jgi:hypothetical protein